MTAAIISGVALVLVALLGLVGAVVTSRASKGAAVVAASLEERKVNRADFDSITRELRAQIADLRTELDTEREARMTAERRADAAEERAASAEQRAAAAEAKVGQLQGRVSQLETDLAAARDEIARLTATT